MRLLRVRKDRLDLVQPAKQQLGILLPSGLRVQRRTHSGPCSLNGRLKTTQPFEAAAGCAACLLKALSQLTIGALTFAT